MNVARRLITVCITFISQSHHIISYHVIFDTWRHVRPAYHAALIRNTYRTRIATLQLPHAKTLIQHSNKASNGSSDKSLSTSQSMPSLGTHSSPLSVVLGSSGEGKESPDDEQEISFQDQAVAKDDKGKQRAYAPEEESYMTSTKMAYVLGEMQPETIPMHSCEGRKLPSTFLSPEKRN